MINYTYKFKLEPNKKTSVLLDKHFGSVRYIYNYFLNQRKTEYLENKISLNYNKQAANLTLLKKELLWLNEINSQSLQYSLKCLDTAYGNFFTKKAKFPNFKSKKSKNYFTAPQSVSVKNNKLYIPKFKNGINIIIDREIKGVIKKCTISKTATNKYYVSILTEQEYQPVKKTGKEIAIDLGLKDFLILSNGLKIKNHRFYKKYERKLKLNQKHLSRKTKGSSKYEKQRLKIAGLHEKISNSRKDLLHKVSHDLINKYDIIYLEDLNVKGMVKNHKLSKSISDVAWGTFLIYLSYKAKWNHKEIVNIDRFFPSSKTCNRCGFINNNLTLNDRSWTCPKCNTLLDRDINASQNILREGKKIRSERPNTAAEQK